MEVLSDKKKIKKSLKQSSKFTKTDSRKHGYWVNSLNQFISYQLVIITHYFSDLIVLAQNCGLNLTYSVVWSTVLHNIIVTHRPMLIVLKLRTKRLNTELYSLWVYAISSLHIINLSHTLALPVAHGRVLAGFQA